MSLDRDSESQVITVRQDMDSIYEGVGIDANIMDFSRLSI